jgi:hypothetical protein
MNLVSRKPVGGSKSLNFRPQFSLFALQLLKLRFCRGEFGQEALDDG